MAANVVKNIAIVGAGGRSGQFITEALLRKGTFNVSALTRAESTNPMPKGVQVKTIDYNAPSTITDALKGTDVLIITMAVTAPPEQQNKLIEAAAEAQVPFVMPNEWGYDYTGAEKGGNDVYLADRLAAARKKITDLGKSSYIAMNCGFWYQYSMVVPACYGFDIKNRHVTYIDDGDVKIDTSTWPQVGHAVANLLSLKIKPDGNSSSSSSATLEDFKNKHVRFNSFHVNQRDMFKAILAASNTKESDWKISHEKAEERYAEGVRVMKGGDRAGYGKLLYTRMFYNDEPGNMTKRLGLHNDVLGLPKEDIVEATKYAVELGEQGKTLY